MIKIFVGVMVLVWNLSASDIYATFNIQALHSASLAFSEGGIVKEVRYEVSQGIKKGELLAVLSNDDKKASLESAKTALKYAKKDYERQVKVKNLIDEGKFDAYEFKYESAKSRVALEQSKYDKTFLKAPFDGVLYFKDIEVGDTVSGVSLKTVYGIQSRESLKLVLEFDQKYHNDVKVGDTFKYTLECDTKEYSGSISKIYPQANTNNRKMQAEVIAKNFIVGLFGDGYILPQKK